MRKRILTSSGVDGSEYVPTLNRRSKWSSSADRDLKTGDLVWIVEVTSPRGYYPLARVVKLNYGSDATARSAKNRTTTGNLIRPSVKALSLGRELEQDWELSQVAGSGFSGMSSTRFWILSLPLEIRVSYPSLIVAEFRLS